MRREIANAMPAIGISVSRFHPKGFTTVCSTDVTCWTASPSWLDFRGLGDVIRGEVGAVGVTSGTLRSLVVACDVRADGVVDGGLVECGALVEAAVAGGVGDVTACFPCPRFAL